MRISVPRCVSESPDSATRLSQTAERLDAILEDARGAFSRHTVRALKADLYAFASWCAERGLSPLPALARTVAAYVEAMAAVRAPATVRRYVFSIVTAHRAAGEQGPLEHPEVQRALQRMRQRNGCRQRQVQGLTWKLLRRLMEAAGDRLIDLRNRAILAVAYDAMLRRSELVALQVVDMKIDMGGSASLLVRRGKTDPQGAGATLYLHRDSVTLVRAWLAGSGIASGRLFRSVRRDGDVGEALDESQVPRIFKAMAERAGLPSEMVRRISGHSPRVGAAPRHDCLRDRDPGDPAGRTLEERLDGAALRRRTARAAPEAQMSPENPAGVASARSGHIIRGV